MLHSVIRRFIRRFILGLNADLPALFIKIRGCQEEEVALALALAIALALEKKKRLSANQKRKKSEIMI